MDDLQYQLHQAKRSTAQELSEQSGAEPKWLSTMPDVYGISLPFSRLIDQLPAVKATKNPQVIETYFNQLVAEVAKLYSYQVEVIELSDTIPDADKSANIKQCLAEGRDYLAQLGALLLYDSES